MAKIVDSVKVSIDSSIMISFHISAAVKSLIHIPAQAQRLLQSHLATNECDIRKHFNQVSL